MIEMNPEPLKGKRQQWQDDYGTPYDDFDYGEVKSAVAGLIKFHEDRAEELIAWLIVNNNPSKNQLERQLIAVKHQYESIMAIEHWLEDTI